MSQIANLPWRLDATLSRRHDTSLEHMIRIALHVVATCAASSLTATPRPLLAITPATVPLVYFSFRYGLLVRVSYGATRVQLHWIISQVAWGLGLISAAWKSLVGDDLGPIQSPHYCFPSTPLCCS